MAAQTTDRLWSSTQVLGSYHGQAPAAAGPEIREDGRCRCCPYGYHIDVDFLNYLKAGSGLSKLKKIHGHRLRQRQAMEAQLLMIRPPTSTPPPGQQLGFDGVVVDASGSSGSSSPVTPWSQSEDERDTASTTASHQLMADLDASIADALDSIEALMQPRRQRSTESSYDTVMTVTAAAGCRSVSTGDVYRSSGSTDGQISPSTGVITQFSHDPSPPLSSVSCSSLHDDDKRAVSSTPDVFQPTSTQSFSINDYRGNNDPSSQSSTAVELRRQSETMTVATTTVFHESSKLTPPNSSVSDAAGKSYTPRPPVKPRSVTVSDNRSSKDLGRETRTTSALSFSTAGDPGTDTVRRLPLVTHSELRQRHDPAMYEGQTIQHSTISASTTCVETMSSTSSSTTTIDSTDAKSFGRQLPVPPKPTVPKPSVTSTSKESSFSSVRALLNRQSGGTQRPSAARVDRPVRRSRHQVDETVETKPTSGDVISAPVPSLPSKTSSASDHNTTATVLQSGKNDSFGTTMTSTWVMIPSKESITASSCTVPAEVAEVETEQRQSSVFPPSLSCDRVDHESMEVSFEELAKAMAILSPIVEGLKDGCDMNLNQAEVSASAAANAEVLMTIRKYIASSLQQMRMMEQQVKLIPVLQLRVSVLKEEKRLLKLQLQNAKNGSSSTTSKTDACVGVTLSEVQVAGNRRDPPFQLEINNSPDQLPVVRRDVGVGDSYVDINTDSTLYCPSCKTALRQHPLRSAGYLVTTLEASEHSEAANTRAHKSEPESENDNLSVSLLVSKIQGQDKNDPPTSRGLWSVEKTIRGPVTSPATESSADTVVRRPKPPVPFKEISIHREEWKNQSTVGIQCTLLKDNTESRQDTEILTSELDSENKRMMMERGDFRAQEPDLVTTHCLGGLSQNEHQLRPGAALKTFADKGTETDRTSQHSTAVNTDSPTVEEAFSKFGHVDTKIPVQVIDCSVNTDVSGNIWREEEYLTSRSTGAEHSTISKYTHNQLDGTLEPEVHEQMGKQTTVSDFVDTYHAVESTTKDISVKDEVQSSSMITARQDIYHKDVIHSVKDASCFVDIVTKPVMIDASSCTDDSVLSSSTFTASEPKYAVEVKPSVKDVECLADITIKPSLATTACNTETSIDQLLSRPKTSVREAGCNTTELLVQQVEKVSPSNLVDAACGDDDVKVAVTTSLPDVADVGCNTEVELKRDFGCSTIEEKQPTKDVSCLAVIKLSLCDKSCSTVPVIDFDTETVKTDEGSSDGRSGEIATSKDVACLTDSLTTCEMSSNTEEHVSTSSKTESVQILPTGSSLSCVEAGCMTDILWKPPTQEIGCNTDNSESIDVVITPSSMIDAQGTEDAPALKPPSATVALNTDDWLLTSDLTFLDTMKRALRPSVTDTASMIDFDEQLQSSTSLINVDVRKNTYECSTNTDAEIKPLLVSVESLARPVVCDVGCSTEAENERRQVRDAASSADIILRPPASDVSVNTDAEAESFSGKPSQSVASNTNTTIHPFATETAPLVTDSSYVLTSLAFGADLPNPKDASSATGICHVSVGTEATLKPLSVDAAAQTYSEPAASTADELWSETSHIDGVGTVQRQDKEVTAKADTSEVACFVAMRPPLRSIACGTDAEIVSHDSCSDTVSDTADLHPVCDVTATVYEQNIRSEISQSKNVADLQVAESPMFPETREIACNTENMLMPWLLDDPSRLSTDIAALKAVYAISTAHPTNDEGAQICRLCGVQSAPRPPVTDAATITDISPQISNRHWTDITAEREQAEELLSSEAGFDGSQLRANEPSDVEKIDVRDNTVDSSVMIQRRQIGVEMKPETKDVGCDVGQILTTDVAINTDLSIDLLEAKQKTDRTAAVSDNRQVDAALRGSKSYLEVVAFSSAQETASMTDPLPQLESVLGKIAKDVACGTSDVILPTYEEACSPDNASFQVKLVAATSVLHGISAADKSAAGLTNCPTCLAKPPTRDSSCGNDDSPSLSDSVTVHVESAVPSRTVCEVGCNTDWSGTISTTAEAACNTESSTCDVGLNTDPVIDAAVRKPSKIPQKLGTATRRPDEPVAKAVTKDAFCITDIAISPSDDDGVLEKKDDKNRSRAVVKLPATAEVACNTDVVNNVETSMPSDVEKLRPTVREVGCSTDLTSADKKPSTRDAGCTARPQTKTRSCLTDPISSQPVTETPVKAVERTRTGLQITRRVKSQSVTTTRSTDTPSPPPTTLDAPVAAATKSPTSDVACGTDMEFHSKYFNMDDGGLLRQLSADDVADVLRHRVPSSSLSSPTCDVACNTEHDSRPCTPARVNYSRYYAAAAVDPPPPTSADVACGPDTPSLEHIDVGCGTEDCATSQTSSDVDTGRQHTVISYAYI